VTAPVFNFLLRLEERRAVRLQYCFSIVWLVIEPSPALAHEEIGGFTDLYASLTASRLRSTDVIAPMGEHAIGVLLIDAQVETITRIVTRTIQDAAAGLGSDGEQDRLVRWSAGGASYPRHGTHAHGLLQQAEGLMSRARAEGGNRLCLPV
jgi:diguanylate cyclase with GGDEF domain